jgi:hypothetical protein
MLAQLFLNACVTGMRITAPLQSLRLGHGKEVMGRLIAVRLLPGVPRAARGPVL